MKRPVRKLLSAAALTVVITASTAMLYAQTYTDLFNFDGIHGSEPQYPQLLAQGRDGNLYGTTPSSKHDMGVVFRFTPGGIAKVLHTFDGTDGDRSFSGLTLGTDGDFYGTTFAGGTDRSGTVFKITPNGTLTTLHNFTAAEGQTEAPPIQAAEGNFYGTVGGIAYRVARSGTFTSLASLPGPTTTNPLLQATNGDFYGTGGGGTSNLGTAFRITSNGTVTVIFNFDPHVPEANAPLIQASDGNFYGTTYVGGDHKQGVVFKLTPKGAVTALHNFPDPNFPKDGTQPHAGLLQASDGNLYGVTEDGGSLGYGVIFELTFAGDYSIVYNFDPATGSNPTSTPMQHTDGTIYGLTQGGGTNGLGVAYSLNLGLPPFVRLLPVIGKVGETVEILGQGFTGTTAVSFNGISATFNVESDTYLTAIVPTGATSGVVSVTTLSGILNSNQQFQVKP
ncbi:MAG: choice-of-anchor tandem repeat GloVer-containing protein [Terriglobia bacterium]